MLSAVIRAGDRTTGQEQAVTGSDSPSAGRDDDTGLLQEACSAPGRQETCTVLMGFAGLSFFALNHLT